MNIKSESGKSKFGLIKALAFAALKRLAAGLLLALQRRFS
jgi:hypothetical protein